MLLIDTDVNEFDKSRSVKEVQIKRKVCQTVFWPDTNLCQCSVENVL